MKYIFKVSTRNNKKYDAYTSDNKYITSFGDKRYQHYKDTTTLKHYKHLDHNDPKRRASYYARHGKTAKPGTAKWFSHNFLW